MNRENFLSLLYYQDLFRVLDNHDEVGTDINSLAAVAFIYEVAQLGTDNLDPDQLGQNYTEYCRTQFEISGGKEHVKGQIKTGMRVANNVIDEFTNTTSGHLRDYHGSIDLITEIRSNDDPGLLWSIILNPKKGARIRFEALRKIQLLEGYLTYHQTSEKTEKNASTFIEALEEWWAMTNSGFQDHFYSVRHSHDDYAVLDLTELTDQQPVLIGPFNKVYKRTMREIETKTGVINVFYEYREKTPAKAVIKQIRKDTLSSSHPDDVGFRFTVEDKTDVMPMIDSLMQFLMRKHKVSMFSIKSSMDDGAKFNGNDIASADGLQVIQFGFKLDGIQYEIMVHTLRTSINETYQDGVGHKEYEVTRLFDNGVVSLLFPEEIYGSTHLTAKRDLISQIREDKILHIEPLIEQRTGMRIVRYGERELTNDIDSLVEQIKRSGRNAIYITPVDDSAWILASSLARGLNLKLKPLPDDGKSRLNSEEFLLVQNAVRTGAVMQAAKSLLPHAMTACLIDSSGGIQMTDFKARTEDGVHNWYLLPGDPGPVQAIWNA